jgi:3-oxoadipate CoA-transferase beta subunit
MSTPATTASTYKPLNRQQMAWRAAQDIQDGNVVNLGIGIPTLCADYVPKDREILFHSENGILGMGPKPASAAESDPDLINAGKQPVTLLAGGSYFVHSDAFVMIRGGHLDLALLGAFEVSEKGDLANWMTNDTTAAPGVGGAMDLAVGAKEIRVLMEHATREGEPRIRLQCTYPLTAAGVVKRIYTNLAMIDVTPQGLVVREMVEGITPEALQKLTEAKLTFPADLKRFDVPAIGK